MPGKSGNRKYGRRKDKPAQKRYTSEKRWERNKRRKMQKLANKIGKLVKFKVAGKWEELSPK